MRKNRYNAITSNLSFAPRGAASGWNKISWLDNILRKACRAAVGITQHAAVDESMIKCLSKYCPWIQYMPKKPIKRGMCMNTHTRTTNYICTNRRYQSFLFGTFHRLSVRLACLSRSRWPVKRITVYVPPNLWDAALRKHMELQQRYLVLWCGIHEHKAVPWSIPQAWHPCSRSNKCIETKDRWRSEFLTVSKV